MEARQLERGEKGETGENGKDADPVAVSDIVAELIGGDALKTLIDLQVAESMTEHLKANPPKDGKDGAVGPKGDPGEKGLPGTDGKDGIGLAGALIDRDGSLVVTLTDGSVKSLGPVVGRDGESGRDGADGLGFDDADVEIADGMVVLKYRRGDLTKQVSYPLPTLKHIGFWGAGKSAKAGEMTTHDGSLWLAMRDTAESPSYQAADWMLAARKGADGQRGKDGKEPSTPVKLVNDNG